MSNLGGGLYSVDYTIAAAGTHDFKFRKSGDWDVSIGSDFGNSAGNAQVLTTAANQTVTFQLDLPNGRWITVVPEPSTLGLAVLGGLAALGVVLRRRS
jgi:hypothetical protein